MNEKKVSVVVPVLNEEDNVRHLMDAFSKETEKHRDLDWEFLFIDDGSKDSTVQRLIELRREEPRIQVIQLSRNFGSYNAIRAGFDHASGDAVICISADLQDPPSLFSSFIEKWREGYHIVWAVRQERRDPWTKRLLATLFYRVINRMALRDLPVNGMDVGLFDRVVIHEFKKIPDRNNITFMTIFWMGFRQARIPYTREARLYGQSNWPLGKRIRCAIDVITSFSEAPLQAISLFGILVSLTSFVGMAIVLVDKLIFGIGGMGWPSLMLMGLFFGGIQLIMLGLLGEYIWRINAEVRGRPHYIVMSHIGLKEAFEGEVL